jgi:hypothetical protein
VLGAKGDENTFIFTMASALGAGVTVPEVFANFASKHTRIMPTA